MHTKQALHHWATFLALKLYLFILTIMQFPLDHKFISKFLVWTAEWIMDHVNDARDLHLKQNSKFRLQKAINQISSHPPTPSFLHIHALQGFVLSDMKIMATWLHENWHQLTAFRNFSFTLDEHKFTIHGPQQPKYHHSNAFGIAFNIFLPNCQNQGNDAVTFHYSTSVRYNPIVLFSVH